MSLWVESFFILFLNKKRFFFFVRTTCNVFIELVTILLLLFYGFCGDFLATRLVRSWFPDQGSHLYPLHWKVKS